MTLLTSVYSAYRGYAWSNVPSGLDGRMLDAIYSIAAKTRPDFADENDVQSGLVSDGSLAAAFAIRRIAAWDAEGRASDYGAFAFFPAAAAASVDLSLLLLDQFFWAPSRTPPQTISYVGPAASAPPLDAPGRLLCRQRCDLPDAHSAGALLSQYATRSVDWAFRMNADGSVAVTCSPWRI